MAFTGVKVTMFIQEERFMYSEAHWSKGDASLAPAIPKAKTLYLKRQAICGTRANVVGVRLSLHSPTPAAIFIPAYGMPAGAVEGQQNVVLDPGTGTGGGNASAFGYADKAHLAMKVYATSLTGQARTTFYVSGIPDAVTTLTDNSLDIDPNLAPGWGKKWNAYVRELIANWGFKGKVKSARSMVTDIQTQGPPKPPLIGIVTNGPIAGNPTVGDRIFLRKFKMKLEETPPFNGTWVVDQAPVVANPFYTYFLQNSLGLDPSLVQLKGTAEVVDYQINAYETMTVLTTTHRARGGRELLQRGRRNVRT